MYIKQLHIAGVRNLRSVRLSFSKGFNAFCGENGSGKTSLLEAIHILGTGSSFRTQHLQQVINFSSQNYTVSGIVSDELFAGEEASFRVGTEKKRDITKALFIKNAEKSSIGEIARLLPILLVNSTSLEFVEGGPLGRRAFIDFGMFHVEHSFLDVCRKFKRCLMQRNADLKMASSLKQKRMQTEAWNEVFITTAEIINQARKEFVLGFSEIFNDLILGWKYYGHVFFQYKQGWEDGVTLKTALEDSFSLDAMSGCTNRGPHRGDLEIFIDDVPARNILSRGQQKVFVCAMVLAKAIFLKKRAEISSIFLVDDLVSELDNAAFKLVISKLAEIGGQVFITGIENEPLVKVFNEFKWGNDAKLFHVEQIGNIYIDNM
jgi:DNA replication and repair protein RecF